MKALKIVIGILFGFIALALVGALILVLVVDPNDYKPQIEKQAAAKGVELKFDGDIGWSFYPGLGVRSGKLSVKPQMKDLAAPIQFESMAVFVQVLPLFKRKVLADQIRIQGGELTLQGEGDELTTIRHLNLLVNGFNLQQEAFDIELSLEMESAKGKKISQRIVLDSQLSLVIDKAMQKISISKSQHNIQFSGDAVNQKKVAIVADFPAEIDLVKKSASLKPLQLQIDKTRFNGHVISQFSNIPSLDVALDGDNMDLDYYLETPPATQDDDVRSSGEKEMDLIPAKTIQGLPGNYALTFKQLTLNHLHMSDFAINITITPGGLLTIKNMQTKAYEGDFKLTGTVDARQPQPRVAVNLSMTPLQLEPALKDYLQLSKAFASGDFSFNANLNTQGLTRGQLMQALNGQFSFASKAFTLNDIDLTQSVNTALLPLLQTKLPQLMTDGKNTVMNDVAGTGVIHQGVVNNTALTAKSLCTTFNGKGSFDLVRADINYRMGILFPSSDTTPSCAEVNPKLKDISWPVLCKGNLDGDTSKLCGPDMDQINDLLKKSAKKEANKKLEGEVDKQLKKKFGADSDAVKESLKGLFR